MLQDYLAALEPNYRRNLTKPIASGSAPAGSWVAEDVMCKNSTWAGRRFLCVQVAAAVIQTEEESC